MTNNNNQKKLENMAIGIIGFGNFGKVISQYLFPKNQQIIYSRRRDTMHRAPTVTSVDSIQQLVEQSDIIIPAVPIRQFASVIKEVASSIKPNQIIMDVCSVKEYPVEIMKKYLDNKAHIIATHPMFGPNSIKQRKDTIIGLKIVMYNLEAPAALYNMLKTHFANLGLDIIEMSPEEHDKISAQSQFFSLIVGQLGQTLNVSPTAIDTPGFAALYAALQYMGPDRHIIEDILTYNVYCRTILTEMIETLEELKK